MLLLWAIENGYGVVVKLLAKKGTKLESKDINGQTLLLWAAENGYKAVVKLLAKKGTKLESKDGYGRMPLS